MIFRKRGLPSDEQPDAANPLIVPAANCLDRQPLNVRSRHSGVLYHFVTFPWLTSSGEVSGTSTLSGVWRRLRRIVNRVQSAGRLLASSRFSAFRNRIAAGLAQPESTGSIEVTEPTLGCLPESNGASEDMEIGDAAIVHDSVSEPHVDQWSLGLLLSLEWKHFEAVATEYFRMCGFHAEVHGSDARNLADLTLFAPSDCNVPVSLVQCRNWDGPVGVAPLQKLSAAMLRSGISRGVFVTSSTFDEQALAFATASQIFLIDGVTFLENILGRPPAQQTRLLELATSGDFLTPAGPQGGNLPWEMRTWNREQPEPGVEATAVEQCSR